MYRNSSSTNLLVIQCCLILILFSLSCSKKNQDENEVQFSRNPNIVWDKTFSSYGSDVPHEIISTKDGGFLISAFSGGSGGDMKENVQGTSTDFWIIKIDQNGGIVWQNTIGGNSSESYPDVIETDDGGFLVGGSSFSRSGGDKTEDPQGLDDYWIVKLNNLGEVEWDKTIGGQSKDNLSQILETTDGYLLGGTSYSFQSGDKTSANKGGADIWLVKVDKSGQLLWQKSYGGDTHDLMHSIIPSNDGGYLIAANSKSSMSGDKSEPRYGDGDAWIFQINEEGEVVWDKTIGSNLPEALIEIIELPDGSIFAAGTAPSKVNGNRAAEGNGARDFWFVGMRSGGDIIWQKSYGGSDEEVLSNIFYSGEHVFAVGISRSGISGDKTSENLVSNDAWILKLSPDGELLDETTLRGDAFDRPVGIVSTADGNLLTLINSNSRKFPDKSENNITSYEGLWLVKLTEDWK